MRGSGRRSHGNSHPVSISRRRHRPTRRGGSAWRGASWTCCLPCPRRHCAADWNGITHWPSDWAYVLGRSSSLRDLTLRLWPLAVAATNRTKGDPVSASEPAEQDPYAQLPGNIVGSPAGQLAEVFG